MPHIPKLLLKDTDAGRRFAAEDRELDLAQEGPKWLSDSAVAQAVVEVLIHGNNERKAYDLYAWVVMPNHVHVVMKPHERLPEIMRWLKAASSVRANRILGRSGRFWAREYYDHWMRDCSELRSVIRYTERNAVKAGFVQRPEDWRWSSVHTTGGKIAGVTPGLSSPPG